MTPTFCDINGIEHPSSADLVRLSEEFAKTPMDIVGSLEDGRGLIVEETPQGFVVTLGEFVLADHARPNKLIDVRIAGQWETWNARCVLSRKMAIPAIQRFLLEGDIPRDLGWIDMNEFKRWEKQAEPEYWKEEADQQ